MAMSTKGFIFDTAVIFIVFAFLLQHFPPRLLLSETTVSGGDTGSHNYLFHFMRTALMPDMKLTGWSPDWYLGFPAFQFYFPLAYAIGAILSSVMHPNVATKIVTVLGTFLLPISAYASMRLMKFDRPIPSIAAVFSLLFLFIESNSVWGGNIPSTLSGEFTYSLSFSLSFLFIASLYDSVAKGSFNVRNSVLFSAVILTHVYTAIFSFASSLMMLMAVKGDKAGTAANLIKTYFVSSLLVAFWALPLVFDIHYKTGFGYRWNIDNLSAILPGVYLPIILFSFFGAVAGVRNKDARVMFILHMMALPLVLYLMSQFMGLVDVRFLPFAQFSGVLLASFGLGNAIKKIKPMPAVTLLTMLLSMMWINNNILYIDGWVDWNYSGYESKSSWGQFTAINEFLRGLPYGIIFHEYSPSHSKFGTPRAFESFPMFTGKPVIEGLTIESGLIAPFSFYLQSELSESPTCPIPGLRCSYFDAENGTKHLKLFNVKYVVATSDKLKNALDSMTAYAKLNSFDDISIYELNYENDYAIVPKYEPIAVITRDWRNVSMEWFKNTDMLDVPLVFVGSADKRFSQVVYGDDISGARRIPAGSGCDTNSTLNNNSVYIETSCVGKPLLIKVPYFPDWTVEGADKIYLTSPGFMLVFPESERLKLSYGSTTNSVGNLLTLTGLLLVFSLAFAGFRKKPKGHGHPKDIGKHGRYL